MTVAAIIQARFNSSRLPGKMLETIGDKPALLWCLDRCRDIPGVDAVVCAVPESRADDGVADLAAEAGYFVTRGSEDDVLARYAKAAREIEAKTVLRITSDCQLLDPQIAGQVLELLNHSDADYTANNMPPKFPHGFDCEAFSAALLYAADEQAYLSYDREHVTPFLRKHPGLSRANLRGPGGGLEKMRWTLDHPEDLTFFRTFYDGFGPNMETAAADELVAFCLRRPDLGLINQSHIDQNRLSAGGGASLQTSPVRLSSAA